MLDQEYKSKVPEKIIMEPDTNLDLELREGIVRGYTKLTTSLTYVNYCTRDVYIITRDGVISRIPAVIPPVQANMQDEVRAGAFYIHKRHVASKIDFNTSMYPINARGYENYTERARYTEQQHHDKNKGFTSPDAERYYYNRFHVSEEDLLRRADHGVYAVNLDVVVTFKNPALSGTVHPYTLHGRGIYYLEHSMPEMEQLDATAIIIDIVDDCNRIGDRFINISGRVVKVRAHRNNTLDDGIYIYHHVKGSPMSATYYKTPGDIPAGEVQMYPSEESAKTGGDPKSLYEAELRAIKSDMERDKHNHQLEMMELDRKLSEAMQAAKLKELELTERQREIDHYREQQRAQYARDSQRRKDTADEIKWMAGLAVALFGAVAAVAKIYYSESS